MNKFAIAAVIAVISTPALAQTPTGTPAAGNQDLAINLSATVANRCSVYNASNPTGGNPVTTVNFGELADTASSATVAAPAFAALYICNVASGFTRSVSSQNLGNLFRAGTTGGANNAIPYTFQHGGGSGLGFPATQLTTPVSTTFGGSSAFLAGQTGSITLRVSGVQVASAANSAFNTTNVFAGNYSDVVTVDIVGN